MHLATLCQPRGLRRGLLLTSSNAKSATRKALRKVPHGISEKLQPCALFRRFAAGPLWVLRGVDEALGMRHEAEHASRAVADAGHVALGAVRIADSRVRVVPQHELLRRFEAIERGPIPAAELPLSVRDGQLEAVDVVEKNALPASGAKAHPAALEPARLVPRERGALPFCIVAVEQPALDEHLKAVADAEDQLAGVAKRGERIGEMVLELVAVNAPGRKIVAVAEPARQAEDLVVVSEPRRLEPTIEMHDLSRGAGALERIGAFRVAIRTGSTKHKNARGHMQIFRVQKGK